LSPAHSSDSHAARAATRQCLHRPDPAREARAIAVEDVTVRFGTATALDRISVTIPLRRLTAVVGPSGAGKTTLLKVLSCELPHGSGEILIEEVPARLWPKKKRESCMLTSLASDCQTCNFVDPCVTGVVVPQNEGLRQALGMLGLTHLASRSCASLSARDASRIRLAAALAPLLGHGARRKATHLWLDDPLDGLDNLHAHRLMQWLAETAGERQTTVVALADHGCARSYAHHVILLRGGRVIAAGEPRSALAPARLTDAFGNTR
jgi:iron complex transport system ATP-binding protein